MIDPPETVIVRYWAGAKDAAGTSEEMVSPGSISQLLGLLSQRHGPGLAHVIEASVIVLDGVAIERSSDECANAGAVLEVLPPYSGG